METTVKKLFSDPPFSLKFIPLTKDQEPLDKPVGSLVIALPDKPLVPAQPVLATAVILGDVVTFTLTGKYGEQHFVVSDGVASAGLKLIVKSTLEEDAQLVETATLVSTPTPGPTAFVSSQPVSTHA